jgi:ATP-GRASP peptide maturase of grasp-with-spasm system
MILILTNDGDLSSDLVQDWLQYYNHPFIRVNTYDFINKRIKISLTGSKIQCFFEENEFPLEGIGAVWFRKYGFFRCSDSYKKICETKKLTEELINHITKEFGKVIDFFNYALRDRNWLTDPKYININKFDVLYQASKCGLNIADSYIINSKDDLKSLTGKVISKSVLDPILPSWGGNHKSMMYTTVVDKKSFDRLPEKFMPSLVQRTIAKKYELRIFYICGRFYPMAIFSQSDKKTKLDFRNYNWDKPNRYVPCELDVDTRNRLRKLMDNLHLNCGSIDMIKGTDNKLYFLEINPTGQFGMVDFPCNYGLHKIVAEELIRLDTAYLKVNV